MRSARISAPALAMLACVGALHAQQVNRSGHGTPRLDAQIDRLLEPGAYRVLSSDTLIARNDTMHGPVLTLGNRLVIEGTVLGDLVIVDANVYARPTARIMGAVTNIGGGFYRSEQATIAQVYDYPLAPYHVVKEGENVIIVGDVEHRPFHFNFQAPQVNRVESFRPFLGGTLSTRPARVTAELYGWLAYATGLDEFDQAMQGGGQLWLRRGFTGLGLGIEQTHWTNDSWIRGDPANTLGFVWDGDDLRNYYLADLGYIVLARDLNRGAHEARIALRGQREKAFTLRTDNPWVIIKPDTFRTNPFINDGVITSGILNLSGAFNGQASAAAYNTWIELAQTDVLARPDGFMMFVLWGRWAMRAIANHTLQLRGRFQGPIGVDSLPRQRWAMLGGSNTLPTFDDGQFLGDRMAFLETTYSIPLGNRFVFPVVGGPRVQFIHQIGRSWTFAEPHSLEQNIALKLQFPLIFARVVTDPADLNATQVGFGVTYPTKAYPWERRARAGVGGR